MTVELSFAYQHEDMEALIELMACNMVGVSSNINETLNDVFKGMAIDAEGYVSTWDRAHFSDLEMEEDVDVVSLCRRTGNAYGNLCDVYSQLTHGQVTHDPDTDNIGKNIKLLGPEIKNAIDNFIETDGQSLYLLNSYVIKMLGVQYLIGNKLSITESFHSILSKEVSICHDMLTSLMEDLSETFFSLTEMGVDIVIDDLRVFVNDKYELTEFTITDVKNMSANMGNVVFTISSNL